MAPGRFTVDLDPTTPERIKSLTDNAFMQVVVTACRVDSDAMSVSSLLGVARYAGVYRCRSKDRCRWEGAGLHVLLGDEDGKANTYAEESDPSKRPLYDGSNTSVIRNNVLRNGWGGANGLSVGTISSSATPTKSLHIDAGDSPRDVLEDALERYTTSGSNPYEYRINPPGTLDVALRNSLFPTTTSPTCLATRRGQAFGSGAGPVSLLPVTRFDQADDWEDFSTEVTVSFTADDYAFGVAYAVGDTVVASDGTYYECASAHTSSGANLPPNATYWTEVNPYGTATLSPVPYDDLAGSDIVMRRVTSSRAADTYDGATNVATRKLGRFDDPDRRPSVYTDLYDPGSVCRVGDSIWLFDPDSDTYSLSTQVDGGAGLVFPLAVRVRAMEWPIRRGMGVYAVVGGSSGTATDVTDWVQFDSSDARLELGQPRRQLLGPRFRFTPA